MIEYEFVVEDDPVVLSYHHTQKKGSIIGKKKMLLIYNKVISEEYLAVTKLHTKAHKKLVSEEAGAKLFYKHSKCSIFLYTIFYE